MSCNHRTCRGPWECSWGGTLYFYLGNECLGFDKTTLNVAPNITVARLVACVKPADPRANASVELGEQCVRQDGNGPFFWSS